MVQESPFTLLFILFFGRAARHVGSQFPDQGLNPRPLQWKRRVLTTGPPGKSLIQLYIYISVPFQGTSTQQPSSLALRRPREVAGSGAGIRTVREPHHWLCQELFSEATALLLHHSGLCPLGGDGDLLPDGGLSHPLYHVKELSPLPIVLSPVFLCPVCSFSCTSPGSLGKLVGSGFDREKTNKYCINLKICFFLNQFKHQRSKRKVPSCP